MRVIDTDVLSIWQDAEGAEYERLSRRLAASDEPIFTTIVSFEEQMRGWLKYCAGAKTPEQYIDAAAHLHQMLTNFQQLPLLDFNAAAAAQFRRLKAAKVRIGTMDLRIAAIALANNATLITRNLSDFRKVPGLRAEDWTRP